MGTLPGGEVSLEADPYPGGSRPDRVSLEGTRGTVRDVWAGSSGRRTALAHPPSGLAQSRWPGEVRQLGVVTRQLSPTDPLEETIADGPSRVLRGAFVKA